MSQERRRAMIVQTALPLLAEYGSGVTTSQIARAAGIGEATIFRAFTDKDELLAACVTEVLRPDHVVEQIAAIPLDQPLPGRLEEAATAMEAHLARLGAVLGAVTGAGRRPHARTPHRLPVHDRLNAAPEPRDGGPGYASGGSERGLDGVERESGGVERGAERGSGRAGQPSGGAEQGLGGVGDGRRGTRGVDRDASFRRTQEALAELFVPERASLRLPPEELAGIFLGFVFNRARGAHGGDDSGPSVRDVLDVFLHGALSKGDDA